MLKASTILITFILSLSLSSFAETERLPASMSSNPEQIRAEISRLRADAVGKNGKPNPKVINDISKLENKLSELKFKEGRSNR